MKIIDKATLIAGRVKTASGQAKIDPMVIATIIEVIVELIKMWRSCHPQSSPSHAGRIAEGLIRGRLQRHARRSLNQHDIDEKLADPIVHEVVKEMHNMSDSELVATASEYKGR